MNNIYFLILFYQLIYFAFVNAIYIPYGQLECDIFRAIYQIDTTNDFSNWKNGNSGNKNINDKNGDSYTDLLNKFYKDCILERPIKSVRYIKNYEEIFKKERELKNKLERNERFNKNNFSKFNSYSFSKEFEEQLYIINIPYHYNLKEIVDIYLPVSFINFSYEAESDKNYVGFLDILQDSLIFKKEIKEESFIRQALCQWETYKEIYLIYNEWDIRRIGSQKMLDLEEEEYRSRENNNNNSQRHLQKHFNRFVRNNMDQEWTKKLFKMDDDNIMNWPSKFYNEIIKVFNFSDKDKEKEKSKNVDDGIGSDPNSPSSEEGKKNGNENNGSNSDYLNGVINGNSSNNSNGNSNKKSNDYKESTLEKLKEMVDYVHYQEKFSGNICRNKYYNSTGEASFEEFNVKKLFCPLRLEDKLKMQSNEMNKKHKMNINTNTNNSSNVNVGDNNAEYNNKNNNIDNNDNINNLNDDTKNSNINDNENDSRTTNNNSNSNNNDSNDNDDNSNNDNTDNTSNSNNKEDNHFELFDKLYHQESEKEEIKIDTNDNEKADKEDNAMDKDNNEMKNDGQNYGSNENNNKYDSTGNENIDIDPNNDSNNNKNDDNKEGIDHDESDISNKVENSENNVSENKKDNSSNDLLNDENGSMNSKDSTEENNPQNHDEKNDNEYDEITVEDYIDENDQITVEDYKDKNEETQTVNNNEEKNVNNDNENKDDTKDNMEDVNDSNNNSNNNNKNNKEEEKKSNDSNNQEDNKESILNNSDTKNEKETKETVEDSKINDNNSDSTKESNNQEETEKLKKKSQDSTNSGEENNNGEVSEESNEKSSNESNTNKENNTSKENNTNSNTEHKNRFFSFFLRSDNDKDQNYNPPPSMEDDIIYSVKDLKLTGKEHFNFASLDCAATVLKSNPELKTPNAILNESKDSYSNNICQAKEKFVIIELCEDILIDRIIIGNFEYFSSMYKDIKVSISTRYPPKDGHWKLLAFLRATNSRDIQIFKIKEPISYVKYVRFDFLSYYGYEYFCPVSLIRIHGRTMMDEYIEDEGKLEEEVVIETPPYPYSQPGYPFLTLPPPSKTYTSDNFEDFFPFLNSDSFLGRTSSSNGNHHSNTNGHGSSSSSSRQSTSSSSSSSSSSKNDKTNPINLFSLFIKHYGDLNSEKLEYSYDSSNKKNNMDKNRTGSTNNKDGYNEDDDDVDDVDDIDDVEDVDDTNNNVEKGSNRKSRTDNNFDENKGHDEEQPHLHESVFKTIMRRLTALERNTTLSFKYLEEQGKIFNQYILYLHKKQQSSLKQLIEDNNMMYDNNLRALKNEFDSNWKEMWNELQVNKQIYYDTIKQIAFKIENIEQSYDRRMFALLIMVIFSKLIWIIIKKIWSLFFIFSSKSKKRSPSVNPTKQNSDYYFIDSDESMSSLNNLSVNSTTLEEYIRKNTLSNVSLSNSSSTNYLNYGVATPHLKTKRKKLLRKVSSYCNSRSNSNKNTLKNSNLEHSNSIEFQHQHQYQHQYQHPYQNYPQQQQQQQQQYQRKSFSRFQPPSPILSPSSSSLQNKKILQAMSQQKPPLSPTTTSRRNNSINIANISNLSNNNSINIANISSNNVSSSGNENTSLKYGYLLDDIEQLSPNRPSTTSNDNTNNKDILSVDNATTGNNDTTDNSSSINKNYTNTNTNTTRINNIDNLNISNNYNNNNNNNNINNSSNNSNNSNIIASSILKLKHYYQSPRSSVSISNKTTNSGYSNKYDRMNLEGKEKEKVNEESYNSDDDHPVIQGSNKNNKNSRHHYNPNHSLNNQSLHRHSHSYSKDKYEDLDAPSSSNYQKNKDEDDESIIGKEMTYSPTQEMINHSSKSKLIATGKTKGSTNYSPTRLSTLSSSSNSHHRHHNSSTNSSAIVTTNNTSPTNTNSSNLSNSNITGSTMNATSHRSRPPSIITNKNIISLKNRTINSPSSAPLNPSHSIYKPSSPLRVRTSVEPNYPPNAFIPLSGLKDKTNYDPSNFNAFVPQSNTKERSFYSNNNGNNGNGNGNGNGNPNGKPGSLGINGNNHRNYNLSNKHILKRKKANLVRSPASFPNLTQNNIE